MRSGGRQSRRNGECGFTLLEMLVAVAILAVLLSVIPRSFVAARAIINRSESWMDARLVAETVLNEELAGMQLRPGARRGVVAGREWTAVLTPNGPLSADGRETGRLLLNVRVGVKVSPVETLEIETIRIGLAQ